MIYVEHYTPEQWKVVSESAHKTVFKEFKSASLDRIDFALVPVSRGIPCGYLTCREIDAETLYWQFGGAFPGTKGSLLSWEAYQSLVEWCRARYKRVTTLIENDNLVMLKMAMKVGFRICGVRFYKGILVEHVLELKSEV